MKILIIGSGGREHALAWALKKSPKCDALYCAPGNAGIKDMANCIDIAADDIDSLIEFSKNNHIDLVVIGPEAPLVAGLADQLNALDINVFGPSAAAAQLEGSKGFMKDLCAKYNIPTAAYKRFSNIDEATTYIHEQSSPRIVVKADGLAAGKGVIICNTKDEAIKAAHHMLAGDSFGDAGTHIVIEDFMDGEELSYFALTDGQSMLPLISAQDHKRAYDNDKGPNTGGMGAYSPARLMNNELEEKILNKIIKPTIDAMKSEGSPFSGVLFAGLMIVDNEPYLIEYNARFGDPECQTLMMRLQSDLVEILDHTARGTLHKIQQNDVEWSPDPAMCVVMAAKGYPAAYEKGTPIDNLEDAAQDGAVTIFHAGTAHDKDGTLINVGGRVLGITTTATDLSTARDLAYNAINKINWPNSFYRRDIGWRAVKK